MYPKIITISSEPSPNITLYIPMLIGKVKKINVRKMVIIYTSIETILARICLSLLKIFLPSHTASLYPKKQESPNGTKSSNIIAKIISITATVYH